MFAGPSLPYSISGSVMATSPDGRGVILFGGNGHGRDENFKTIFELRFGEDKWTTLPQKLNQHRHVHVVIPIP